MAVSAKFEADFSDFAKETKKAEAGLTEFEQAAGNVARNVATDLLAMFSVGAVAAFVSDTIEAAGALKVLSQQTQISTDDLQLMAAAMSEFGVSQDELGRGLVTLSKKIASGDDSVAAALAQMGLALEDVKDLRGEELFLTIEKGLATLKGSLRDTAAAALFGDKLGTAMAGASEGIDGTMAKARELNTVMSKEAIDALDKYNAEINRTKTNLQNMTANALGPLAEGFNTLVDAVQRGASKWELFAGLLPKGFGGIGTGAEGLTRTLDRLNQETERNTQAAAANAAGHATVTAKLTEEEQHTEFLRILQQNASKELTAAQIKNLEALKAIGQLNATNAAGVGVTAAEYKKYTENVEAGKKAAAELAKGHREADEQALKSYRTQIETLEKMQAQRAKSYSTTEQIAMLRQLEAAEVALTQQVYAQITSEKERMALIEQLGKRRLEISNQIMAKEAERTDVIAKAMLKEAQAHQQRNAALGLDVQGYVKVTSAAETLRVKLEALHAQRVEGVSQTEQEALLMDEFAQANYEAALATDKARDAYNKANTELAKTPGTVHAAKQSLQEMADKAWETAKSFNEMAAALRLTQQAREERPVGGGLLPNAIVGHGGVAYDQYGRPVVPGGAISSLPIVNVNINSPLGTPDAISRAVQEAMMNSYRTGGNRLPV